MDSLITAAGRALASGDPIGALARVALREDAAALALRGIAMAQLGDLARSRVLLRRAARAFGARESLSRARTVVAEAEVALVSRDLTWQPRALEGAIAVLDAHGDVANAAYARLVAARHLLVVGRIDEAARALSELGPRTLSPASRAVHQLALAGIAMRRLQAGSARAAIRRADRSARISGIPALISEVEAAGRALDAPVARLLAHGTARAVRVDEVERLFESDTLVVDACRHGVRRGRRVVPLATRPVLFAILRALAEAWPADAPRQALVALAFGGREADESHRARLRVEIGRLRGLLRPIAAVHATKAGFALRPRPDAEVVVLARPVDSEHAAVLALLSDGESWSSSALGLALGRSQRSVQRALDALSAEGRVQPLGRGRARKWAMPPVAGFATALLLPIVPAVG